MQSSAIAYWLSIASKLLAVATAFPAWPLLYGVVTIARPRGGQGSPDNTLVAAALCVTPVMLHEERSKS